MLFGPFSNCDPEALGIEIVDRSRRGKPTSLRLYIAHEVHGPGLIQLLKNRRLCVGLLEHVDPILQQSTEYNITLFHHKNI